MSHTTLFNMLGKEARSAGSLQAYVNQLVKRKSPEIAQTAAEIAALADKGERKLRRDVLAMRLRRAEGGPLRMQRTGRGAEAAWSLARIERRAPDPKAALRRAVALVSANAAHPIVRDALAALGVSQRPRRGPAPRVRAPVTNGGRRAQPLAPELRTH